MEVDKRVLREVKACAVLWRDLCESLYELRVFWEKYYKEKGGGVSVPVDVLKERKKYHQSWRDTVMHIERKVGTTNPEDMWACVNMHT